eukprot:5261114-Pyramimonas_sp.AAC.1
MVTNGYKLHQAEFAKANKLVEIPKGAKGDAKLTPAQTTTARCCWCATVLVLCQCGHSCRHGCLAAARLQREDRSPEDGECNHEASLAVLSS